MKKIKCNECGALIDQEAQFCSKCGKEIKKEEYQKLQKITDNTDEEKEKSQKKGRLKRWALLIFSPIVALFIVVFLYSIIEGLVINIFDLKEPVGSFLIMKWAIVWFFITISTLAFGAASEIKTKKDFIGESIYLFILGVLFNFLGLIGIIPAIFLSYYSFYKKDEKNKNLLKSNEGDNWFKSLLIGIATIISLIFSFAWQIILLMIPVFIVLKIFGVL